MRRRNEVRHLVDDHVLQTTLSRSVPGNDGLSADLADKWKPLRMPNGLNR